MSFTLDRVAPLSLGSLKSFPGKNKSSAGTKIVGRSPALLQLQREHSDDATIKNATIQAVVAKTRDKAQLKIGSVTPQPLVVVPKETAASTPESALPATSFQHLPHEMITRWNGTSTFLRFQSLHKSSIEITIARADVTEENLSILDRNLKTLLSHQPNVHNIVVYVKDADKGVERLFIDKGFRKQNRDYFVLVARPIPIATCNHILEITKANKAKYRDILPAVTNLCRDYMKSFNFLGENEKLFGKMTAEAVPWAAALTNWGTAEISID